MVGGEAARLPLPNNNLPGAHDLMPSGHVPSPLQVQLSLPAGGRRQTISSLETGKYNPSIALAYKISKYFGMTIEEVFIFEDEM